MKMKLLIGGSPCTHWSIAQTKNRETEASGIGWELFLNYKIARDKYQPDYFLYENNKSMSAAIREQITQELGVEPVEQTPLKSKEALGHEMKILKFREHKILAKIAEYESAPEDSLYISSLMDMRVPGGRGKDKKDGAVQSMGMYSKDSAFSRALKLQEALYKVQGRIAKIADSLRALEESERRIELERERLALLRMRATGAVDVPDPEMGGESFADGGEEEA